MSRVILKISGEALKEKDNVSRNKLQMILETIRILQKNQHKVAIVVGGGNFFRGREHPEMYKVTADTIGMLGTVMNALYIKDFLEQNDCANVVTTPFVFPNLLDNYDDGFLKKLFDQGKVVIFGGGIGKSGFSTDSGTVLAANKVSADLIIKMTNVNGVYDSDPKVNKDAKKFLNLTFEDVLKNQYGVMDSYAIKECLKNKIKILVMNFNDYSKLENNFEDCSYGTIVE